MSSFVLSPACSGVQSHRTKMYKDFSRHVYQHTEWMYLHFPSGAERLECASVIGTGFSFSFTLLKNDLQSQFLTKQYPVKILNELKSKYKTLIKDNKKPSNLQKKLCKNLVLEHKYTNKMPNIVLEYNLSILMSLHFKYATIIFLPLSSSV